MKALLLFSTICVFSTVSSRAENSNTVVDIDEVDEADDIVIGVLDLTGLPTAEFDEQTKGSNWFIKFYAPWCKHCMAMKPTWKTLAQHVHAEPTLDVNIAHVDCTASVELCTDKEVQRFPYLKFYGADSADDALYESGVRTFDHMLDYIGTASRPATMELKTVDGFEAKRLENPVLFVLAPPAYDAGDGEGKATDDGGVEQWKTVFSQVALAYRFDGKFFTSESDGAGPAIAASLEAGGKAGAAGLSRASPIAVVKGDEVVFYKGKPLLPLIKAWVWEARHPRVAEMTHKLAASLKKEQPDTIAVIAVVESFGDNSDLFVAYEKVAKMKKKGWNYQFTWMDYHQWRPYIESNWGFDASDTPRMLVFKPWSQHYAPLRDVFTEHGNMLETNVVAELDLYASDKSVEWFGGKGLWHSVSKMFGVTFETSTVIFAAMYSEYPMLIHASVVSTLLLILVWCTRAPPKKEKPKKESKDIAPGGDVDVASSSKHAKSE